MHINFNSGLYICNKSEYMSCKNVTFKVLYSYASADGKQNNFCFILFLFLKFSVITCRSGNSPHSHKYCVSPFHFEGVLLPGEKFLFSTIFLRCTTWVYLCFMLIQMKIQIIAKMHFHTVITGYRALDDKRSEVNGK